MTVERLSDIGTAVPSGSPRSIPTDQNGNPVSAQWFEGAESIMLGVKPYHEEFVWPSRGIYGSDGRTNSTGVVNVGQFKNSAFYLDVTDMVRDDSNETLDVVLETSYNQGQTWIRFARFNTVETAGAQNQVLYAEPSGSFTILRDNDDTDPAQGVVLTTMIGDRVRAAATFVDAAGADSSGVFSVLGIFKG